MGKLNQAQCENLIFQFFLHKNFLPPGTDNTNWGDVTIKGLALDDPPLDNDPNFHKRKVSLELQSFASILGGQLKSPIDFLKKPEKTLMEFATWCSENNEG